MAATALPHFNMDNVETDCCPKFDPTGWDEEEFEFDHRLFVRAVTRNFLHIPLNMVSMMTRTRQQIRDAGADLHSEYLVLSTDPSPWRGEHYFAVTKDVPRADMVVLSGRYLTKVFEGPYREAGKWAREMKCFVASKDRSMSRLYFFYTTCPKCAKYYGKNFVVAFAEV